MSTAAVAGVVTLVGVASSLGALGYLHVAPTGLRPMRNAVSQYGISPYRAWYRVLTVSMGVAGAGAAIAIGDRLTGDGVATVLVLVWAFAACRLVISWFPMDAPGAPRTSTGAVHGLLALTTFGAVGIAALRLGHVLDALAVDHALAAASRALGWAMVAFTVLMLLSRLGPDLRRWFGAIERAEYAAILAWLVAVGVAAATGRL